MNFYIMTLFPEMIEQGAKNSILGRALDNGIISLEAVNIRDYTEDKHRKVDDYPYGGGAGMLMQAQPVYDCWRAVEEKIKEKRGSGAGAKTRVIYLTPQGKTFHQEMAGELAKEEDIIFLCGHYEGIDERALEEIVTDYVSIGDYVLTGGELPALVMIDAIARLAPGVLHNEDSAGEETFYNDLLEYSQYSRPEQWHGKKVPEVLLSGNHKKIREWRLEQSEIKTQLWRPDLYEKYALRKKLMEKLVKKNKALYADMSESLGRGRGELIYGGEDGAVVWDKKADVYMLSSFDKASAEKIVDQIPERIKDGQFILHEEWLLPPMERRFPVKEKMMCQRAVYNRDVSLPRSGEIEILQLDISWLPVISAHYHLGSEGYVEERLLSGAIFGAFIEGKLAGFIGEHIEGSLGMLEVFEEYRRKGIAAELESYMINLHLSRGHLPYGDVIVGNEASMKLQRKLGLKVSKEIYCWAIVPSDAAL